MDKIQFMLMGAMFCLLAIIVSGAIVSNDYVELKEYEMKKVVTIESESVKQVVHKNKSVGFETTYVTRTEYVPVETKVTGVRLDGGKEYDNALVKGSNLIKFNVPMGDRVVKDCLPHELEKGVCERIPLWKAK